MRNIVIFLFVLILITGQMLVADTGSGESAAGSLTSLSPSAPTLDNPANGATEVLSSDVTWNTTTHAATYNLQVSTVSNFASTVADETGLTTTTHTVSGLSGNVKYYWHVSATNVSGTSAYSDTWDFTTDASLPVVLASFSAEPVPKGILLKWITESEIDNLGFVLERASSVTNPLDWQFIASYQTTDELAGQGNASTRTVYSYTDETVRLGQSYQYRLSDVNTSGDVHIYDVIQISMPDAPEATSLDPSFPNPFNSQAKIGYQLSSTGHVEITIFDLMGRTVQTLISGYQTPGSYNLYWNGKDDFGNQMASGTYFILLKTANEVKKQKLVLLR